MPVRNIINVNRDYETARTVTVDSRASSPSVSQLMSTISVGSGYDKQLGATNPNYRDQIARGSDASTSYNRTYNEVENVANVKASVSTLSKFPYRIDSFGSYTIFGTPGYGPLADVETQNRALTKIKNQLRGRAGQAKLMAPTAEIRELHGLVRQATLLSTNFVLSILQAKRTRGRSVFKFMGDAWLGYSFALAPLINDIGSAGNAIATYLSRQDQSIRLSSSASKFGSLTYVPQTSVTAVPIGCRWKKSGVAYYKLSYRYVGAFDLFIRSSNDYSMLEHLGVGFSHIPATLYELTAFSWMFDYFTNIGSFIEDAFVSPPGSTKYLVENRRLEVTSQNSFGIEIIPGNPNGITLLNSSEGFSSIRTVTFKRTPLQSLPHAGLYVKSFDTISSYGISKLLNLIALVAPSKGVRLH